MVLLDSDQPTIAFYIINLCLHRWYVVAAIWDFLTKFESWKGND